MNLNRRDFAKTSLGGLLAVLLPGKAKARPEYPRYFVRCESLRDPTAYLRADDPESMFFVPLTGPSWQTTYFDLAYCEDGVRRGTWKEITTAEAEALLKPKRESALPARKTISLDELDRAVIGLWDKMGRTATRFTVRTTRVLSHELLRQVEAANRRIPVTDALTFLPWYYLTLPNYVAAQVRILPDSMMPPDRYYITTEAE